MDEKIKVMLVDDENDILSLFKDIFTKRGYMVETALSGDEALVLAEKADIDVVLLDIRMPGMDGIEVLARLKEQKPLLPVVMLTAYGYDEALIDKALKLGASGYISKNLPLAQILNNFSTILSTISKRKV